jgi:hypothetical protein
MSLRAILDMLEGEDFRRFLENVVDAVERAQNDFTPEEQQVWNGQYLQKVGEYLDKIADEEEKKDGDSPGEDDQTAD